MKIGKIYTANRCCRDVRLSLLDKKIKIGEIIEGYRRQDVDEIKESWKIIKLSKNIDDIELLFLGYKYEL